MNTLVTRLASLVVISSALSTSAFAQSEGPISKSSKYSVTEMVTKLEAAITQEGTYRVLSKIDHGQNAMKAEVSIKPSVLILFGNPKGAAPLQNASPTISMDLPMKALVWEGADGKAQVSVNEFASIVKRHGITGRDDAAKAVDQKIAKIVEKAME
jgi:uncharacterized protein (DUF302 family)